MPVGSFPPNKFGLYDMVGNVAEWTEDCYQGDYNGAPTDGSAWLVVDNKKGICTVRVFRGGSWYYVPGVSRSARRGGYTVTFKFVDLGFRVARTLAP
jgi:formylglycine-generating enzyme required for sulfatase activity